VPSNSGIVASGAMNFNPLNWSPFIWLDASDTSSITSSAGKVSQWNDKSGNARHFTQATSANQPTTGAATQNGFNVISFNGSQDVRRTLGTLTGNITVFSVFNITGQPTYSIPALSLTFQNNGRPYDRWQSATENKVIIDNVDVTAFATANIRATSGYMIHAIQYDTVNVPPRMRERKNRVETNFFSSTTPHVTTNQVALVGRREDALTSFIGNAAEILIFSSIITGTTLTDIETYLSWKWGTP
jgi:hypothetical protein